jgi:hypothetical protein
MAATGRWYGQALLKALTGEINYLADDIYVMLATSAYLPNQDTHVYKSDVSGEVTGAGYTAGGVLLAGKTLTYDPVVNTTRLDATDVTWPSSTITARYAIVYDSTPATDAARPLLGYVDFETDRVTVSNTFLIAWSVDGLLIVVTT